MISEGRQPWERWRSMMLGTAEGQNLSWLIVERVAQLVVSFVVGIVVARHLGVHDYGRLAYAVALTLLLTPFVTVGQSLVVRDISMGAMPAGVVLGSGAVLSTAATVVAGGSVLLIGLAAPGSVPPGTPLLVAILVAGTLVKPAGVVDSWFQATLAARRATLARNAAMFVGAVARVIAVVLGGSVIAFAVIVSVEGVLSTGLMLVAYARAGGRISAWSVEFPHLRQLARQALPLLGASVSVIIYMRVDQVMLGALSGIEQNGRYAIGVNLSEIAWFAPLVLSSTVAPRMARLWHKDHAAFTSQLESLFTLAVAASYLVVILTAAVAPWFIPLAYGRQFADVVPVVLVLSFATPFVFLGIVQDAWTINANQQGLALGRTVLAAVLNIGLNFMLLPRYGALGAAVTTVVSYAAAAMVGNLLWRRSRPICVMQFRACALMGLTRIVRDPDALRAAA